MELDAFAQELFQDIISAADADRQMIEDVAFEKLCAPIQEAGDMGAADRVAYQGPPGSGIRVDGYGGDPLDDAAGTLVLIILDFDHSLATGRLTNTDMGVLFRRLRSFLRHALDQRWRNGLEETSPAFGLADLIAERWPRITSVRLLLVSNRELSERAEGRENETLDDRPVTFSVWDLRRLYRFLEVGRGHEDIDVDLSGDFGGPLAVLPAEPSTDDFESYLCVISGQVLAAIYDRFGARLLEQNVRVFLQARGKVNRGIRNTLENEPSRFFAYNNGITATAEEVDIERDNGRLLLHGMKNFQIVNGGQTTASLHVAYRGRPGRKRTEVDLSRTSVQVKLTVVDRERAAELVPKISEYANTQNRVSAADFFSNHPFHVRLENFSRRTYAPSPEGTFVQSKWFYERARGQYADARSQYGTRAQRRKFDLENPRRQLFTKTDLAKFWAVWERRPHVVSLGAQKNFADFAGRIGTAWEKDEAQFNEAWFREVVAKAIVFRRTERIVSVQDWYQGGYRANIVAYTIAKLAHDVEASKSGVDFEAIWRRQALTEAMEEALALAAYEVHEVLVSPPEHMRNVTEWAKKQGCWNSARSQDVPWPDAFLAELISVEEKQAAARSAKRSQRELNGLEAQIAVVQAGAGFWRDALQWDSAHHVLSAKETGVLQAATRLPDQMPTDKQSLLLLATLRRLQSEGYPKDLPASQP